MSLTSFLKMADVKAKLRPLRPKIPRKINAPLRVEPRSPRYMLVGTAFDYLLRFELHRHAPYAMTSKWVAEVAYHTIWRPGMVSDVAIRARNVVESAKSAVVTYRENREPSRAALAALAAHALRLAKLDDVVRGGRADPTFEVADPEDVEELLALVAIVPIDALRHDTVMLLNPTFGESSRLVGGADADLVAGDMLIDFKTKKTGEVTPEYLDQLLGYFILARNQNNPDVGSGLYDVSEYPNFNLPRKQRHVDPTLPAINRLGLYFSRHGHLWSLNATTWTENQLFAETEEWFFKRAKEIFSPIYNKLI